jgi:hypothetical protein
MPDKNKLTRLLEEVAGFKTTKSALVNVKIKNTISSLMINN